MKFHDQSPRKYGTVLGSNSGPLDLPSDMLLTALRGLVIHRNTILFGKYNLCPLDIYNGPSQVYCIKPEGRIHSYIKV